ncbi:MAG: class I SAM-dependent methyltransferase [Cyanobacteria bacterium P01_E01_bin.43]
MKILNLGCGTKTSESLDVVNIDWSIYLRMSTNPITKRIAPFVLDKTRLARMRSLPNNIMVHNLAKGIPFKDGTADVVYHSHVLEHLDFPIAMRFLEEARRVLKPNGVLRVVVPDFEMMARAYVDHLAVCEQDSSAMFDHNDYLRPMIEQSVRREAFGTTQQRSLRRLVENLVLGDARQRGETHQWMYDRFTLQAAMKTAGYSDTQVCPYDGSWIAGWAEYGLDANDDGSQYKTDSLYVEGRKPA